MNRRTFTAGIGAGSLLAKRLMGQADPALVKATGAVREAIPRAESDPDRPIYHFRPPANWTNDPNGTIYYRGWHHLFYQLNPFAARIGSQHWGHARSRDLVNWEHLPIAIWPSTELGETAIYSGGAVIANDGRPRLIYTSIGHAEPEQWMAIPEDEDLFRWKKYRGNPVLNQAVHAAGPIAQWRDPFLFQEGGVTYIVCGGAAAGGRAQVQLYAATAPDLTSWRHLGPVYQSLDREIRNYECPNLFPLDGKWVLIVSPNRPCEYWVGDLDLKSRRFIPSSHGVLDAGDSYASNISVDDRGRTLLWLWGRTNTPPERGWGSVMTMPRVISIGADGYLRQNPAPEFETLRGSKRTFPGGPLDKPIVLEGLATDCAEFEVEFTGGGVHVLELRRSAEGKPAIEISIQGGYLNAGSARAFVGSTDRYRLRVFLDKRCVEVFANDGAAAVYKWFEAGVNDLGVAVSGRIATGRGGATPAPPSVASLAVWPMKGARFSLEHFTAG
jgi:beta-fructofuranosidase